MFEKLSEEQAMSNSEDEQFATLCRELDELCKPYTAVVGGCMAYGGNEDSGYFANAFNVESDPIHIHQDINQKLHKFSASAANLFIDGKFTIDRTAVARVKSAHPDINFSIHVGERDSFGPVTYCIRTKYFLMLIA